MGRKKYCIGQYCIRSEIDDASIPVEMHEEIDATMRQAVLEETFYAFRRMKDPQDDLTQISQDEVESHLAYLEFVFEHLLQQELISEQIETVE
jgi:hypothetical protein